MSGEDGIIIPVYWVCSFTELRMRLMFGEHYNAFVKGVLQVKPRTKKQRAKIDREYKKCLKDTS